MKSYCYSAHEIQFIIANLVEGFDYLDKLILYEYNYTHTGIKKDYEIEKVIHLIPEHLKNKLDYNKIDISKYIIRAYNNEPGNPKIHNNNEPVQRSWFFNDTKYKLNDNDIIIDNDIDEIIYKKSYIPLIRELNKKNKPLSIKLNQFFYKNNYLWSDCNFSSPTIYKYGMVKKNKKRIKGLKIFNQRDLQIKTDNIYGCHMSWVMPVDYMIKKLHSYSHPEYRKFANKDILTKAVNEKKYIFDNKRNFNIHILQYNDEKIPTYLQKKEIFDIK